MIDPVKISIVVWSNGEILVDEVLTDDVDTACIILKQKLTKFYISPEETKNGK